MRDSETKTISRREFGKAAATAAGLSLVPTLIPAALQDPKPAPGTAQEKPPTGAAEAPSEEALALAGIVKLRYGSRLNDAAMQEITRSLDGNLKSATTLRKVPLQNGDEPAVVFRAWRGEHD
jgi:hypothetical protein